MILLESRFNYILRVEFAREFFKVKSFAASWVLLLFLFLLFLLFLPMGSGGPLASYCSDKFGDWYFAWFWFSLCLLFSFLFLFSGSSLVFLVVIFY